MAGTRSAPTVDGTPVSTSVSLRYIDPDGEVRSHTIRVDPVAATDILIEALVAATQLITNASIYEVKVTQNYSSIAEKSLALNEVWSDVSDNIVLQFKEPILSSSLRNYAPAPINAVFVPGTEDPDAGNALVTAWIVATEAIIDVGYTAVGIRFNQRRDLNQQIKI